MASSASFLVLHALRLKGVAGAQAVARATGQSAPAVEETLDALSAAGWVDFRTGRVGGFCLSAPGRDEHLRQLAAQETTAAEEAALDEAYGRFVDVNETFKQLCTDWQLRPLAGELVPNDHADPDYDAEIRARLAAFHERTTGLLRDLGTVLPRFEPYAARFEAACSRFRAGEPGALLAPMAESYHDAWMELHQDLLLSLGRQRGALDGH